MIPVFQGPPGGWKVAQEQVKALRGISKAEGPVSFEAIVIPKEIRARKGVVTKSKVRCSKRKEMRVGQRETAADICVCVFHVTKQSHFIISRAHE